MPGFTKGPGYATPFGRNVFLRSTKNIVPESYTFAASTLPAVTIDGFAGQKVLQPGTALAKITSGPEAGKVGPFQAAGTREVQTITKTGTWTSGTYKASVTLDGITYTTTDLPMASTAATVQAALVAAGAPSGAVVVTGGPLNTTALVFTYHSSFGGDIAAASIDSANIVGGGTAGVVETTAGVAGANDGRGELANLVGLNNTFLPWQLMERDVEVASLYICTAVQGWCFEYNAAGTRIALTNTTADALRGTKGLQINFK